MTDSFPSPLTALQRDLLDAFFAREQRFILTGGAALGGFHLHHRESDDLDLFTWTEVDLDLAERTLEDAARSCGAGLTSQVRYAEFRRYLASRGDERCMVDLVIEHTERVEPEPVSFGAIRVDSLRELAASKVCTLIGRAEIRDLVDLAAILDTGVSLEQALADAARKDASADAATLAWLLDDLTIPPDAELPGGGDASALDAFRARLVTRLRRLSLPGS